MGIKSIYNITTKNMHFHIHLGNTGKNRGSWNLLAWTRRQKKDREGGRENILNRILSKDNMPGIFHHIRSQLIRQIRHQNPVIKPLIVTPGSFQHLIPRHGKLRTTWGRNHLRHLGAVEQFLPRLRVDLLRRLARLSWGAEWLNLVRTARSLLAAEVDVAVFLHKVGFQGADGLDIAVGKGVGVPGLGPAVFVAMEEDNGRGEVVVVLDDVLEVGEALAAFVDGGVSRGIGIVDGVDNIAPSAN